MLEKYTQFLLSQQAKRLGCAIIACLLINHPHLFTMENNGRGTKAIGMANAFVAVSDNCWAIDYNPAGLASVIAFQCSAFIVPEQFGLQELQTTALAATTHLSFATIGIEAEKFGFDLYKETEFELALASKVDRNISAGLSLEYHRLDIVRYGTAGNFSIHGGLIARVLKNVDVGFSAHNITAATIGRTDEKMPQVYSLGACWFPFHDLQVSIEMEKDIRFPASIKMGIEQMVFDVIALRAGTANNPDKYSLGIAARYSFFEFGYAGYSHPDLGWTHQIELSFKLDE
ncbi:MAG: hypothetical protein ABR936_13550 [Bacteroidota bacterium]